MTKLLLIAAVLVASQPAHADFRLYTGNGGSVSASCYRSFYGTTCRTWHSDGMSNNARVIAQPVDITPNTNPDWGKGCNSCADVSK